MSKEAIDIPKKLTEVMQLTAELMQSSAEDLIAGGDDAIQTEDAYGGPVDAKGKLYRFTFHEKAAAERWDVILTSDQVNEIANGKLEALPRLAERPAWADEDLPCGIFIESEEAARAKDAELEQLLRKAGAGSGSGGGGGALAALFAGLAEEAEAGQVADKPDDSVDLEDARGLLKLLLDAEVLELAEGADLDALAKAIAPLLEIDMRPDRKAAKFSDTLLDHDAVEELHASDEELTKLLDKW